MGVRGPGEGRSLLPPFTCFGGPMAREWFMRSNTSPKALIGRLSGEGLRQVAQESYKMLGALDAETRPEVHFTAMAMHFLMMCERFKVKPQRVLEITEAVIRDSEKRHESNVRAWRMYLANEVKG